MDWGVELVDVAVVPLTRCWVSIELQAQVSQVITLGEREGVCAQAQFRSKLTPGALFVLPTYSLRNRLCP